VMGRPGEPAITDAATGVVKYDLSDGSSTFHDFGPGCSTSEPVFVPRDDDEAEDAGWIVCFVFDRATSTSRFMVLDASDMTAAPQATISVPQRVPHGFHGSWIPD
jgi:carotenoid cleavage dioxygenase-like enzyme